MRFDFNNNIYTTHHYSLDPNKHKLKMKTTTGCYVTFLTVQLMEVDSYETFMAKTSVPG